MTALSKLLDKALTEIENSRDVQAIGAGDEIENILTPLPYDVQAELELKKEDYLADMAMEVLQKFVGGCDDFVKTWKESDLRITGMMKGQPIPEDDKRRFLKDNRDATLNAITGYLTVSKMTPSTAWAIAEELLQ